jgi:hypothetical protein
LNLGLPPPSQKEGGNSQRVAVLNVIILGEIGIEIKF